MRKYVVKINGNVSDASLAELLKQKKKDIKVSVSLHTTEETKLTIKARHSIDEIKAKLKRDLTKVGVRISIRKTTPS